MDVNRLSIITNPEEDHDALKKQPSLNFRDPMRPLPSEKRSRGSRLCPRCSDINFDEIRPSERRNTILADLGPMKMWATDSCAMCLFFAELVRLIELPPVLQHEGFFLTNEGIYPLQGVSAISFKLLPQHDNHPVESWDIRDEPFILEDAATGLVRQLKSDQIDFSILQNWLQQCQDTHGLKCASQNQLLVPHMMVIDCYTRRLEPVSKAPYVALSYVWGKFDASTQFPYLETLPMNLPKTIEDTITVTKEIGIRYLWIDRYCINQERKGHAMSQIRRMDSIYNNAAITIIAAAGHGPSYGLPGVSSCKRQTHPSVMLDQHHLIHTMLSTTNVIAESILATRGWTYQEGVLCQRRLAFTDQQVYFECPRMSCYESFKMPWPVAGEDGHQKFPTSHIQRWDVDIQAPHQFPACDQVLRKSIAT
jgi:hypothetical protein